MWCWQERFLPPQWDDVLRLAELAELLGLDVHIRTDYGDEIGGLTPWELFDEADARQALAMAEQAVAIAPAVVREYSSRNCDEPG